MLICNEKERNLSNTWAPDTAADDDPLKPILKEHGCLCHTLCPQSRVSAATTLWLEVLNVFRSCLF